MNKVPLRPLPWCLAPLLLLCCALAACSSTGDKGDNPTSPPNIDTDNSFQAKHERIEHRRDLERNASELYKRAHERLLSGNYTEANKEYDMIMSRFPFSRYATQAQLEQVYAKYRSYDPDDAIADANRFLREHPRHPHVDYVMYLKGLIDSTRDDSLTQYLPLDQSGHDPAYLRSAFEDFALLVRRFPDSRYAWDAHLRMISLRDRIAAHELNIANFYVRRGAWLAAARRAEDVIAGYPGAPATAKALLLLKTCYTKLGLKDQEKQVETLIAANQATLKAAREGGRPATSAPRQRPAQTASANPIPPTADVSQAE